MLNNVSHKVLVSFWALVISALSCKPNASGDGFNGNVFIYVIYSSYVCAFGWIYVPLSENLCPCLKAS